MPEARDDQTESIGARVKRLRMERKLSQDRLAIEAHVDQSGLSKFERGRERTMGEVQLRRIAAVLQTTYEALIDGTDTSRT
jgi:transcriptional regulator with XRE-family HTH domain